MMKLMMLLLLCHAVLAGKHSLMFLVTESFGAPNVSEFLGAVLVDGIGVIYCDRSNKIFELRLDWLKNQINESLESQGCFDSKEFIFKKIFGVKQELNQSEGVHIIQGIFACELDENTENVTGAIRIGYNKEDFLEIDSKTLTWVALKPEADITKQRWDADIFTRKNSDDFFNFCPALLKYILENENIFLQRTALPSVSLLQKTPSSPVSCHATGFYPNRAVMFWRKDGEELHEGVDPGEILPNNDGTFQMSTDLNVSSVTPEDWKSYDCVFQFSDSEDIIISKLDKTVIKTNRREKIGKVLPSVSLLQKTPSSPVSCHATGFYPDRAVMFWRKDGVELHEGVDRGEILPNNDGTFQMSVDLNVSSVTPGERKSYDCVFQLSDVEDIVITKLNETVIRTNFDWRTTETGKVEGNPSDMMIPIIAAVIVLAVLILILTIGFAVYKKKRGKQPKSPPDNSTELSEKLNPET